MATNPTAPVYAEVAEYPKVLFRFDGQFNDEEALKAGLAPGGAVKQMSVPDADTEAAAIAQGWTAFPMDFIGSADEPSAALTRRTKKAAA